MEADRLTSWPSVLAKAALAAVSDRAVAALVIVVALALGGCAGLARADDRDPRPRGDATAATEPGEGRAVDSGAEPDARPDGSAPPRARRVIEEIVVTAQKTEERLHDVPISMTVVDTEFLSEQGITELHELGQHVPNVKVLSEAFTPQANIRGFELGRDANKGSEPPMGLTIDGIPYPNPNYLQSGFFDVGRIEVLRGPQNTLFGKNNSVGLFNMVTKNPTDELDGFVDFQLGEPDRRRYEAAIGGPVIPGVVNVRIAALSDGLRTQVPPHPTAPHAGTLDLQLAEPERRPFEA
ncbi:MAG: TonB-dependent receptor plug domain-containing protein, partial [Candidatus Binatia bacterium]